MDEVQGCSDPQNNSQITNRNSDNGGLICTFVVTMVKKGLVYINVITSPKSN